VMSGCLVARSLLKHFEASKSGLLNTYLQRWIRIMPTLVVVLLLYINSSYYLDRTMPYSFATGLVSPCEKYWWSTLLHLQVYTNRQEMVRSKAQTLKCSN